MNANLDSVTLQHADASPPDLEQECETWAFAQAAGVSAQDLRSAVEQALGETSARR